ncbi:hypothetical protein [Catenovulum agarivorans]|uniref:hypothetical protein n=1 Tax=Catenovulum agarivorans TaxID=1172192 RepID=UPI000309C867|nr:hypothetical protein [Catenovulum agarivorans]
MSATKAGFNDFLHLSPALSLLLVAWLTPSLAISKDIVLVTPTSSPIDVSGNYASALLHEALELAAPSTYKISYSERVDEARAAKQMQQGRSVQVMWAAARTDWEASLIVVKHPILKGLMGQRVLLINRQNQLQFSKIESVEELKKLRLGAGHTWSVTAIFQHHQFNVVTSSSYEGLFKMLAKDRFDYFPRGVSEVLNEFDARKALYPNMAIEESIILQTDLPVYFYVTPVDPILALDITNGLSAIIENGRFDELFNQHFAALQKMLQLSKRKIFQLK